MPRTPKKQPSTRFPALKTAKVLSRADFARLTHRTPQCVGQWIKRGLIPPDALINEGGVVKIDVAKAQKALRRNRDPGQALGNGAKTRLKAAEPDEDDDEPTVGPDAIKEKARLLKEQADSKALENARTRRELVPITEVQRRWTEIITQARSRMLAIGPRIRDAIPRLTASENAKIDAEIRKALADLGRADFI